MKYYNKIPIWENKRRIEVLGKFRELILAYYNNVKYVDRFISSDPVENEKAANIRVQINLMLNEARNAILLAGVRPNITYTPPPVIGGYVRDIDVVLNVFMLHSYGIRPTGLTDFIEIATGIYQNDAPRAFLRTINPLFWIGRVFDYIASLPFVLLGRIGFDRNKAESSALGRMVKGILYLIQVFAAALTILQLLGWLEKFKAILAKILT
jgi:hypothetical protein